MDFKLCESLRLAICSMAGVVMTRIPLGSLKHYSHQYPYVHTSSCQFFLYLRD